MKHFSRMTKRTSDASKKNAVVMGRNTWDSIPQKFRPLPGRVNVLVSTKAAQAPEKYASCVAVSSFNEAMEETKKLLEVETVWVIGGASLYKAALESSSTHRIYLTNIFNQFECDTFLPEISLEQFVKVTDPDVLESIQEENGIKYQYEVYERKQ